MTQKARLWLQNPYLPNVLTRSRETLPHSLKANRIKYRPATQLSRLEENGRTARPSGMTLILPPYHRLPGAPCSLQIVR